jgi:hypothetical protein
MKRFALVITAALLFSTAARAQLKDGSCSAYAGTLAESTRIGIQLYAQGQTLEGFYFYDKYLKDIPLKGSFTGQRDLQLVETNEGGHPNGTFQLHLAERDPHDHVAEELQGEVLQGTWSPANGEKPLAVYLRMQRSCAKPGESEYAVAGASDAALVERNVQAFRAAVTDGNREEAQHYVSYPCSYFRGEKRASLRNAADFLKDYDAIFTPAFVKKIHGAVPHHMFANYQGIMIADGAVWFDEKGKAKAFNNLLR